VPASVRLPAGVHFFLPAAINKQLQLLSSSAGGGIVVAAAAAAYTLPVDKEALVSFRNTVLFDKLPKNSPFSNWYSDTDPCTSEWWGVVCTKRTQDRFLHVRSINLHGLLLHGRLETWVIKPGALQSLTNLDLASNVLTGLIPKWFGYLASLKNMSLGVNLLTGNIPPELGMLYNLEKLNLDGGFTEAQVVVQTW
jgi:hypothetical protein